MITVFIILLILLIFICYFGWRSFKSIDFYYDDIGRLEDLGNVLKALDFELAIVKVVETTPEELEKHLTNLTQKHERLQDRLAEIEMIQSKFTCDSFTWSFKPFKLEAWLTPAEIEIINKPLIPLF